MKYLNELLALNVLGFQVYLALNLRELSFGVLSNKVFPRVQGVQHGRMIKPDLMKPVSISELIKVSSPKTPGSKWPNKFNEVKLDSSKTTLLLQKPRLQYMPMLMSFTSQPLEILVSVRENKKLLDQQKQRIQRATQRHKTFTTHTVASKVANKHEKFRRSNDFKSMSQKWRKNRVRRELQAAFNSKAGQTIYIDFIG